jgi:hypothetical protein
MPAHHIAAGGCRLCAPAGARRLALIGYRGLVLFDRMVMPGVPMDALIDRPERGNMFATVMAGRLQSLVEILPDGSPNTTTIDFAASPAFALKGRNSDSGSPPRGRLRPSTHKRNPSPAVGQGWG